MNIKIVQTTITTMREDRTVESTSSTESFVLEADSGKVLKNIATGEIIRSRVCVTKKAKLADYTEVADPLIIQEEVDSF
jgi:hypothetical protein